MEILISRKCAISESSSLILRLTPFLLTALTTADFNYTLRNESDKSIEEGTRLLLIPRPFCLIKTEDTSSGYFYLISQFCFIISKKAPAFISSFSGSEDLQGRSGSPFSMPKKAPELLLSCHSIFCLVLSEMGLPRPSSLPSAIQTRVLHGSSLRMRARHPLRGSFCQTEI